MMGEEIAASGYGFPTEIPHYTAGGIPFGYPPFVLVFVGIVLEQGISPIVLTRFVPGLLVAGALVAYAGGVAELLESPRQGAFAAVVLATSPPVLQFTLTAGGTVRAAALLFTAGGIYTGVRLFRGGEWPWVLASAGLFGATVQTHPLYTVFFVTSYLVLFVGLNRTPSGIVRGALVAFGGLALAAPWWLSVAGTHGFELFLRASTTHGGIGYLEWYQQLLRATSAPPSPWPALVLFAGLFLLLRRRLLLPAWFVATGVLTGRDEFLLIVGGMMVSVVLFEGVIPILRQVETTLRRKTSGPRVCVFVVFLLGAIATYGTASASLYVAGGEADDELPMFVHSPDEEATNWVRTNTAENASFVVIGDVAEWFPLFTHRTNLVVPQGTEWKGTRRTQHHYRSELRQCLNASCLRTVFDETGLSPRYVYLSRTGYNSPQSEHRWNRLGGSLRRSNEFDVVFENQGVLIVRRTNNKYILKY